ncbi:tetraspanin-2-like isoform X2 [Malaya genurostris]|uniref:tetraspanin-2-like isoform X2 n=1 Tax=Malaya genurostris TaxID=325434 RepID=UPI0026F3D571|nr:tetraspanin-2-like isoform X2 [Malaya genurostris]
MSIKLILLIGFALVLLSVWMLTDPTFLVSLTQNENNYFIGLYILLVVGGLMLTIAFLGCCGAYKKSQCMLFSFFSCLLIVLVAEVVAGAWVYHNSAKLNTYVRTAVKEAVQNEYSIIATRTATLDSMQKYFHCCGAEGPNDWQSSVYNKVDRSTFINIAISKLNVAYKVPETCCVEGISVDECDAVRITGVFTSIASPVIYSEGCMEKLINEIKTNINTFYIACASIVGVEILALVFTILLCCAIRRNNNYKH